MARFFVTPEEMQSDFLVLTGENARHAKVLRLKNGEDVLVCDGFTGNVTLKTMEGVVRMFLSLLKSQGEGKKRSWWLLLLKRWLQKSLTRRFSHLNPDQYNGACLLGLRGTVIKSHGAANQRAFAVAIEQAVQAVQRQVPQRIAARLESVYPAGFKLLDGGKSGTLR